MRYTYLPGYLFWKLAGQTRMKKTALTAARLVLVRQMPITRVAKQMGVAQPLVSRAVSRIIFEAQKANVRKMIIGNSLARENMGEGIREITFSEVKAGMGETAYLEFILDIKLKENSKSGSAFGLLRFRPVLDKEPLPTQDFLLKESKTIVQELMRENDILVQQGNNFFVITDNVTPKISKIIIARFRDRFLLKLNLQIQIGLSFFDFTSLALSASKMIAQATK